MKKNGLASRYIAIMLLPAAVIINNLSLRNAGATERIYSRRFYKAISQAIGLLTGYLPFSLAEILILVFSLFIIWKAALLIIKLFKKNEKKGALLYRSIVNAMAIASIIYFCFIVTWGLNYNRVSLPSIIGAEIRKSSAKQLEDLCATLIRRTNALRITVTEDSNGVMTSPGGYRSVLKRAPSGFKAAALRYDFLRGSYGYPKPIMLSGLMAYTNIWGIYFPITAEPNVNISIPAPVLPSTACHEMAHQRGIAREGEANYISFIACSLHPDQDFKYSGSLHGLTYTLSALFSSDTAAYKRLWADLSDGVKRDLAEIDRYDRMHHSPMQDFSSKVNDLYLKANNQAEGEKSYGTVVDLLLSDFISGKLK